MLHTSIKKLSYIALLVVLQQVCLGLSYKILVSEGANVARKQKVSRSLFFGSKVEDEDSLYIGRNGYLALLHVSGQVLELKQGKYLCKNIWTNIPKDFLPIDSLLEDRYFVVPKVPMEKPVYRCISHHWYVYHLCNFSENPLRLFPSRHIIEWKNKNRSDIHEQFRVLNFFDEVLFDTLVSTQEFVVLDLAEKKYLDEREGLKISLRHIEKDSAHGECTEMRVKLLDKKGAEKNLYDEMSRYVKFYKNTKSSAIENYVLAVYFHQRKLMWEAYQYCQKACSLNPSVKLYKDQKALFTDLDRVH